MQFLKMSGYQKQSRPSQRQTTVRRPNQRRLQIEELEPRSMLAVDSHWGVLDDYSAPAPAAQGAAFVSESAAHSRILISEGEAAVNLQSLWVPAQVSGSTAVFSFSVPADLQSVVAAEVVMVGRKTRDAVYDLDLISGRQGQPATQLHSTLTRQGPEHFQAGVISEINITKIFPESLAAGLEDVTVKFRTRPNAGQVLGLKLLYNSASGPQGPQGEKGDKGDTGATGPQGIAGPAGPVGATGPQGVAGPAGPVGATGPQGVAGPAGPVGATGPQGIAGPAGAKGATGPQGVAGPVGATGATGAQGVAGPVGATGATGVQGVAGPVGATGATGAQGVAGPQGPPGTTNIIAGVGLIKIGDRLDVSLSDSAVQEGAAIDATKLADGTVDNSEFQRLDGVTSGVQAQIDALLARIATLEALLAGVTRLLVNERDTLQLSGMNLQVVDGSGDTGGTPNGLGNVIIGYNTDGGEDTKTGSHNLVIGDSHTYTQNSTIVAGLDHTVTGELAAVVGGHGNTATGQNAVVFGGESNRAHLRGDVVVGGEGNVAFGPFAVVAGGALNEAINDESAVIGGRANQASGAGAVVAGGANNYATGNLAFVAAGLFNLASGQSAFVVGEDNVASGIRSVALGQNVQTAIANSVIMGQFGTALSTPGGMQGVGSLQIAGGSDFETRDISVALGSDLFGAVATGEIIANIFDSEGV